MTHHSCDRCGLPVEQLHRIIETKVEDRTEWKRWPNELGPVVHVGIEFQLPAFDDEFPDLCRTCQIKLALKALTTKDAGVPAPPPVQSYGCVTCQIVHYEGDPLYDGHLHLQDKRGISLQRKPAVHALEVRRDDLGQCRCERDDCHRNSRCYADATVVVEAYGITQRLCKACYQHAITVTAGEAVTS